MTVPSPERMIRPARGIAPIATATLLALALVAAAFPGVAAAATSRPRQTPPAPDAVRPRAIAEGVRAPLPRGERTVPAVPVPTVVLLLPTAPAAPPVPAAPGVVTVAAAPACSDTAWRATGGRWEETYAWAFRGGSTPDGLSRDAVAAILRRSVTNITAGRNDCGLADASSARARYVGRTSKRPAVTREAECGDTDGWNVVGFGALPGDYLGITCIWTVGGRIVEADMKLDRTVPWATTLAGCAGRILLEAVATHEFGHAFGLGHVGEVQHGQLTMSVRINGDCQASEASLGRGDLLGLESLYP